MLIMSREVGQSIVIEDVLVRLERISQESVEISLKKLAGGDSIRATIPYHERVEICYDMQVVLVSINESKVRLGFEGPTDIKITRSE